MGGFFGGGNVTQTRQKTEAWLSLPQLQYISTATPAAQQGLINQFGLSTAGTTGMLETAQPEISALQKALQVGPSEAALPGVYESTYAPMASVLTEAGTDLAGPAPRSILEPLQAEFNETILPGISGAAIRAGAPGGQGEQDLT